MTSSDFEGLAQALRDDPDTAVSLCRQLGSDLLHPLSAAAGDELRTRAKNDGDHDAIIEEAFAEAFGRDGLGSSPWIEGAVIVCPGAIVAKSRSSHRCRFVSIDDVWVWDSAELLVEDKRSHPGQHDGFKAVALVPVLEGMALDVVSGRARGGQHQVERVVSYQVQRGELIEVSQRAVKSANLH